MKVTANAHPEQDTPIEVHVVDTGTAWLRIGEALANVTVFIPNGTMLDEASERRDTALTFLDRLTAAVLALRDAIESDGTLDKTV